MWDWLTYHVFTSLVGWLGLAGVIVVVCLAVAWFIPPFRRLALMVAGVVASAGAIYAKGSSDAARRKQEEWDNAERESKARGEQARRDAQRDVDAGRVRDKFDRDDV